MNIGVTTTFIVGGLLLIAIITLNNRMMQNSGQNLLNMTVKTNVEILADVLDTDIRRIGFLSTADKLEHASEHVLRFTGDVTGDGNPDVVEWQFHTTIPVAETVNPNDRRLTRTVNGDLTDFGSLSVTQFRFNYTLLNGTNTTSPGNLNQVRRVMVEVVVESPEPYGDDYAAASWQKSFAPANLQF